MSKQECQGGLEKSSKLQLLLLGSGAIIEVADEDSGPGSDRYLELFCKLSFTGLSLIIMAGA